MAVKQDFLDRIERVCAGTLTAKALRQQIVEILARAVPFDGYVFILTDPVTRVGTSPLADVPIPWPRLPELVRWRYQTRPNRWTDLLDAGVAAASLVTATAGEPSRSLMWRHVLREVGVVDSAVAPFADRYGCWGFLDLWRTSGRFTHEEVEFLGRLHGAVTAGLRAALVRTFVDREDQLLPVGPAVVVLDAELQVRSQTAGAATALLRLNPPDEPMAPIPAAAYNVGAALLAEEADVAVGPPWSRVHLGGSRWVTVKASRLAGQDIAVSIEPSTAAERMDLFARAHALSPREAEVMALLVVGLDTKQIAARLVLSAHTVTDHVKAVLVKTGVRTRQVLLSRALGAA